MISVIIPAYNEAQTISECLRSVQLAASHADLAGEKVLVIVVADGCTDFTESIAVSAGALVLSVHRRNVGYARSVGAQLAIMHGARWLSFTDADSSVPDDWVAQQLSRKTDVVCGVVEVTDWRPHHTAVKEAFHATYQDRDEHRHVHGANLGVATAAYQAAGGFRSMTFNEDVALIDSLLALGATISWTNNVRVKTSARTDPRVPWGFGATLVASARQLTSALPKANSTSQRQDEIQSVSVTKALKSATADI